ncbi:MAG TPA: hypothetical protein DEQ28_01870 [Clostridiales bacterium]|nr:hypothetical protein [Clostridiales bacterium]
MKVYRVPFLLRFEERLFGGYLSTRQLAYLLLALVSAYGWWRVARPQTTLAVAGIAFFLAFGAALAFVSLPWLSLRLDTFMWLGLRFCLAPRAFPYMRGSRRDRR